MSQPVADPTTGLPCQPTVVSHDQPAVGSTAPEYEQLLALEAELRDALRGVRLVTEIGISVERYHEFHRAILRLTSTGGRRSKELRQKFPATFVTYVVAE